MDIRVSIYSGKIHSIDSHDMAFMIASVQAFKNAFLKSESQFLEPIYEANLLCDNNVMSDLNARRTIVLGMDIAGHY